jgi:hypothetical protein
MDDLNVMVANQPSQLPCAAYRGGVHKRRNREGEKWDSCGFDLGLSHAVCDQAAHVGGKSIAVEKPRDFGQLTFRAAQSE